MGMDLLLIALPCPPSGELGPEIAEQMVKLAEDKARQLTQEELLSLYEEAGYSNIIACVPKVDESDLSQDEDVIGIDFVHLSQTVYRIYSGSLWRTEVLLFHADGCLLVCGGESWGDVPDGWDDWYLLLQILSPHNTAMPWEDDNKYKTSEESV
jgi:hypothetical protein